MKRKLLAIFSSQKQCLLCAGEHAGVFYVWWEDKQDQNVKLAFQLPSVLLLEGLAQHLIITLPTNSPLWGMWGEGSQEGSSSIRSAYHLPIHGYTEMGTYSTSARRSLARTAVADACFLSGVRSCPHHHTRGSRQSQQ